LRTILTGTDFITSPIFVQRFNAIGVPAPTGPLPLQDEGVDERLGVDDSGHAVVVISARDGSRLRFVRADGADVLTGVEDIT